MAREVINVGAAPNDGTGDPIRTAYIKCNNNFGELYSRAQENPPSTLIGTVGDQAGMYAYDSTYFYYCFQDYDGSSVIWAQIEQAGNVTGTQIVNGTSSVAIIGANANVRISVAGISNVGVWSSSGLTMGGNILPQANATYDLGSAGSQWRSLYVSNSTIYLANVPLNVSGNTLQVAGANVVTTAANGDITVANVTASGAVTATGNVTGANFLTSGVISATGNITGGNILGGANVNATTHTGATVSVSGNITGGNILTAGLISATGNVTGGNLSGTNISGTLITAAQTNVTAVGTLTSLNSGAISSSGNVTGANLNTGGLITATGNVTGGNVISSGIVTASGNITGGNIRTAGAVSATGNITGAYYFGDGSQLSNVIANVGSAVKIVSGTTEINIPVANGNIVANVNGSTDLFQWSTVGFSAQGNITGGNIRTGGVVSATGNITGNFIFGNGSQLSGIITSVANINSGTSIMEVVSSGGNIRANVGGTSNVQVIASTGVFVTGVLSASGNITGGNLSVSTGTISVGNIVNTNSNGVGNIGTTGTRFNTVFAVATSALYADLAEYYLADADLAPGTVVKFGGVHEITSCDQDHDPAVAGIISDRPAYEMNAGLTGDHVKPLALAGRVKCRVKGPIRRGQMLVSAGDGRARAETNPQMGSVIGKALEDFLGDSGLIEVVVGRL